MNVPLNALNIYPSTLDYFHVTKVEISILLQYHKVLMINLTVLDYYTTQHLLKKTLKKQLILYSLKTKNVIKEPPQIEVETCKGNVIYMFSLLWMT
jgi:hypothetical protein